MTGALDADGGRPHRGGPHSDGWEATWAPMLAAVGTDLAGGARVPGADPIERSTIRRYLEPLEWDCPLHYDPEVARRHGHPDVTAPYTSILTWTIPPMWVPGQRLFTSDQRDAQPASSPINGNDLRIAPEITGFFATEVGLDFLRPAVAGDHLARRGNVLVSCTPKWISVGRGAFLTLEAEVVDGEDTLVGRIRTTVFAFEPVQPPAPGPPAPPRSADATHATGEGGQVGGGKRLGPLEFPLTVYRLVMEAGANRDFNSIHHNSEYARSTGAPEMYASTSFLLGMWERLVRDHIGPAGVIRSISGFRMKRFNPVGATTVVHGRVVGASDGPQGRSAEIEVWCESDGLLTVGPGLVTVGWPAPAGPAGPVTYPTHTQI